ncbi:uncharacterized protein FPRO_00887 [Fusarium proliferatum ET1]|uniref:Uncharacterized protein n=1 Tax=Fusarium proliferatum (strain ET1) TaxID=1227346 RepID=A0A1L7V4I0_FUSPR|nr:uncharacterized protein FPRO_00887 [Fusarium proliferatum ET1]CZR34992.1 uncharacterized protein FPRO_00887 [Fusarium proliferatum ET1]
MPYVYKPSILKSLGIPTWEQVRMMGAEGLREQQRHRQEAEEGIQAEKQNSGKQKDSPETPAKEPREKYDDPTQRDNQGDTSESDTSEGGVSIKDDDVLEEQSKGQAKEMKQVRSMVADLEVEVDQLKKHTDKQEGLKETHLEELEVFRPPPPPPHQSPAGVSPVATAGGEAPESVEGASGDGSKPSTSQTSDFKTETSTPEPLSIPCGLYGTINAGPSIPLDGRQESLKLKASVQSSPTPTPTRKFTVGGLPRSNTPRTPSNRSSLFDDRTCGKTDPRRKQHKGRPPETMRETSNKDGK